MEQIVIQADREPRGRHLLPKGHLLHSRYKLSSVLSEDASYIRYSAYDYLRSGTVAVFEYYPRELVRRADAEKYTAVVCDAGSEEVFASRKEGQLRLAEKLAGLSLGSGMAKVLESFADNDTVYTVCEYFALPELGEAVKDTGLPNARTALELFRPALYALSVLHGAGLAHGAVSPETLSVYGSELAILRPELSKCVWLDEGDGASEAKQADICALCRCLCLLFTGILPDSPSALPEDKTDGLNERQISALRSGLAKLASDRPRSAEALFTELYGVAPGPSEEKRQAASPVDLLRTEPDEPDAETLYPSKDESKKGFNAILIAATALVAVLAVFVVYRLFLRPTDPAAILAEQLSSTEESASAALPAVPTVTAAPVASPEPTKLPLLRGIGWVLDRESRTLTLDSSYSPVDYSIEDYLDRPWQSYTRQIETLVVAEGVERLGDRAFLDCVYLRDVRLPSTLLSIGRSCFSGCVSLSALDLSEGLTNIGESTFYGCSSLDYVYIPSSVTEIGWYAFEGCDPTAEVRYAGAEERFSSIRIGRSNIILAAENVIFEGSKIDDYTDK